MTENVRRNGINFLAEPANGIFLPNLPPDSFFSRRLDKSCGGISVPSYQSIVLSSSSGFCRHFSGMP
eukprot:2620164-Amphidinium_carterae.1